MHDFYRTLQWFKLRFMHFALILSVEVCGRSIEHFQQALHLYTNTKQWCSGQHSCFTASSNPDHILSVWSLHVLVVHVWVFFSFLSQSKNMHHRCVVTELPLGVHVIVWGLGWAVPRLCLTVTRLGSSNPVSPKGIKQVQKTDRHCQWNGNNVTIHFFHQ